MNSSSFYTLGCDTYEKINRDFKWQKFKNMFRNFAPKIGLESFINKEKKIDSSIFLLFEKNEWLKKFNVILHQNCQKLNVTLRKPTSQPANAIMT